MKIILFLHIFPPPVGGFVCVYVVCVRVYTLMRACAYERANVASFLHEVVHLHVYV